MRNLLAWLLLFLVCTACQWRPTPAYYRFYDHLRTDFRDCASMTESDYFIVFLVDAPHLDYTGTKNLLQTIATHPNGSKRGDVGHAWIYLRGVVDGQPVFVEGGHSGECGIVQPKYFDGIMDYIEMGECNPVKYLWECQRDGFFQKGSGGHIPTFGAKFDITEEQFRRILEFMQPNNYGYTEYGLTCNQCCNFVARIADLIDFPLGFEIRFPVAKTLNFRGAKLTLWEDSRYSWITFGSPDVLEKSLVDAVKSGKAEYALSWYFNFP